MNAEANLEWSSRDEKFSFDVRRSIILGFYMHEWGMPEYRLIASNSKNNTYVEVYYFPAGNNFNVSRFSTIGLSVARRSSGETVGAEWMLALTPDLGGSSRDRVLNYMVDLIAHHMKNSETTTAPLVMPESKIAPSEWKAKGLLIDELRGENEILENIKVGDEPVPVLWVIPITGDEVDVIDNQGLEKFDELIEKASYSIVDPRRASYFV
ncbi:suppressor of fused domain protein (plasmid) [Agrobacterium sp. rho-13.3]|uniref:suppressor of fused domain protein n=1 Tax=Agrobacterium sp. rho-13.3 TaxID=3072980 RepID=UPI002A0FA934|nr:suppressor of fused domain protein [Agrobacterium sp. rho-13.3]MDX8310135.1 suppressor of fused domain protein [Agrobacterium sp. rho-13.3]